MSLKQKVLTNMIMNENEGENAGTSQPELYENKTTVPLKEAKGWADAPAGAKEFSIPVSGGMERRPVLVIPNDQACTIKLPFIDPRRMQNHLLYLIRLMS